MTALAAFEAGDIFVTATALDPAARYPTGQSRIRQMDAQFRVKAEVATGGTGLLSALEFHPDGRLFAFDPQARRVDCFAPDGTHLPPLEALPPRPFGSMEVLANGDLLLGEHLSGEGGPFAGEGKVCRCDPSGQLIETYDTQVNGGAGGFLGVTHMALNADQRTLYHLSETGPVIYAHDLATNTRLGVIHTREDPPAMLFGLAMKADGNLVVCTGSGVRELTPTGVVVRNVALEGGRGWAVLRPRPARPTLFLADFMGGCLVEYDPATGAIGVVRDLGLPRALAGIAQCGGINKGHKS